MDKTVLLDLQRFAEGGGGEGAAPAGDAGAGAPGVTQEAAAPERPKKSSGMYPGRLEAEALRSMSKQTTTRAAAASKEQTAPPAPGTENAPAAEETPPARKPFKDVLKEYGQEANEWAQDTMKKRLKGNAEATERLALTTPILEVLADKYGIEDASDVQAIQAALEKDTSIYEEEALREGIPPDVLKEHKAAERDARKWRAMQDQQQQDQQISADFDRIYQESQVLKQEFPDFDLAQEFDIPVFASMVTNGFPVEQAYHAAHYKEIDQMRKDESVRKQAEAAKTAKVQAARAIQGNASRPAEVGTMTGAPAVDKIDINHLTREGIEELIRRSQHGEKFTSDRFRT